MEFFERAHVIKKTAVKITKSDETVKRQLKQMLRGYKQNDTKIIKEAENVKIDLDDTVFSIDDSDSVSGFSDLNLSNSSNEGETSKKIISKIENIQNSSETCSSNENKIQEESLKNSAESISEYEEDIQSLPEDTHDIPGSVSENSDNMSALDDKTTSSEINSESDEFDPDGDLASKILKRIKDVEIVKSKKRKLHNLGAKTSSKDSAEFNDSIIRQTKNYVSLKQHEIDEESFKIFDYNEGANDTDVDGITNTDTSTQDSASTNISSPYISLSATDMPDQSLSEILGEYIHPTIRNMPCEKQNVIYTTDNSEIFSTDKIDTTNVVREDEADSLVPEMGDEPTVEDLDDALNVPLAVPIDETIVIDDISQTINMSDEDTTGPSVDSDTVNPVRIFYGTSTCVLIIKYPTKIYLHGKVKAKALGGTIEVFGYTLNDSFTEIYAPNFNFAQCIKTVECQNAYNGLFRKLRTAGVSIPDAEEIVTTIGEYDGILSLSTLNNQRMDFVENNFTSGYLFTKPSKYIDNCFKKASELLGCSLYLTQPGRCFVENVKWEQVINCGLDNGSRAIICGGKNMGKSTFLRYYVNKLVSNGPVLVIDLDPGQAELTVAGNVSATVVREPLIGPNFTHLHRPDKILNIGMINIMDDPSRYTSAIITLFQFCHSNEKYKNIPWVVNTMGMCNNLGLKFVTLTILLVQPTLLVQMDSINQKNRFDIDLHPLTVQGFFDDNKHDRIFKKGPYTDTFDYTFIISSPIEIHAKIEVSLSAKEQRYLNFLAYFGELMDSHSGPGILGIVPYENSGTPPPATPLSLPLISRVHHEQVRLAWVPMMVVHPEITGHYETSHLNVSRVNIKDLNIGTNVNVRRDVVTRVINGKIIALCQLPTPDKGRVFNLRDNAVLCLGHGLVRGVDFDKGLLYIITPAPVDILLHVNTLVYSDWVPELKGQDLQLPDGTVIPYRTTSKQRQLMSTPHRRFNPLQLLKMSRKS